MKLLIIKYLDNQFVEHLQKVLNTSFNKKSKNVKTVYFIGEDDKGVKGLYFALHKLESQVFYEKFKPLKEFDDISEMEIDFMNDLIVDLVISGVALKSIEKLETYSPKREGKIVTHTLYLN